MKFVISQAAIRVFMFFAVLVVVRYFVLPLVSSEITAEIDRISDMLWRRNG